MRINKKIAPKYLIDYADGINYLKICLLILAAISIVFNTYYNPALGLKTLIIFVVAYLSAKISEALYYMFSKNYDYDKSLTMVEESFPEVSGLIFALLVPIGAPIFAIIISVSFAVIIAKMAFGGFSFNVFNVGVTATVIFYISYPAYNIAHLSNGYWLDYFIAYVVNNWFGAIFELPQVVTTDVLPNANVLYPVALFFGSNTLAILGFVPPIIVIFLGLILIYLKVVNYKIPLFICIFTIISGFCIGLMIKDFTIAESLSYGLNSYFSTILVFISFFVATDPVTSPNSTKGILFYSIIIVLVTMYSRELSANIDGAIYAILFANMLVPLINAKSNVFKSATKYILICIGFVLLIGSSLFIGYNRSEELTPYGRYDFTNEASASESSSSDASSSATT